MVNSETGAIFGESGLSVVIHKGAEYHLMRTPAVGLEMDFTIGNPFPKSAIPLEPHLKILLKPKDGITRGLPPEARLSITNYITDDEKELRIIKRKDDGTSEEITLALNQGPIQIPLSLIDSEQTISIEWVRDEQNGQPFLLVAFEHPEAAMESPWLQVHMEKAQPAATVQKARAMPPVDRDAALKKLLEEQHAAGALAPDQMHKREENRENGERKLDAEHFVVLGVTWTATPGKEDVIVRPDPYGTIVQREEGKISLQVQAGGANVLGFGVAFMNDEKGNITTDVLDTSTLHYNHGVILAVETTEDGTLTFRRLVKKSELPADFKGEIIVIGSEVFADREKRRSIADTLNGRKIPASTLEITDKKLTQELANSAQDLVQGADRSINVHIAVLSNDLMPGVLIKDNNGDIGNLSQPSLTKSEQATSEKRVQALIERNSNASQLIPNACGVVTLGELMRSMNNGMVRVIRQDNTAYYFHLGTTITHQGQAIVVPYGQNLPVGESDRTEDYLHITTVRPNHAIPQRGDIVPAGINQDFSVKTELAQIHPDQIVVIVTPDGLRFASLTTKETAQEKVHGSSDHYDTYRLRVDALNRLVIDYSKQGMNAEEIKAALFMQYGGAFLSDLYTAIDDVGRSFFNGGGANETIGTKQLPRGEGLDRKTFCVLSML